MEVHFLMGDMFLMIFLVGLPGAAIVWMAGKTRVSWIGCILGMMAWLGACEWFWRYVDSDKLTLSQRFYLLPPVEAWTIAAVWLIAWLGLLGHLLYGNWKKHRDPK